MGHRFRDSWPYTVVAAVYLLSASLGQRDQTDLQYFLLARQQIAAGHGLHLYAAYPAVQIGPLALAVVSGLDTIYPRGIGPVSVGVALVLLLTLLACATRLAPATARTPSVLAVSGAALAAAWSLAVPGWGHLDDLAALTALVGALLAARRDWGVRCGLLLVVGCACKPWALLALAMLVLLPRRQAVRGAAVVGLGLAAVWLPFLLSAPGTWEALRHYAIRSSPGTVPRLLGAVYAPGWERPAQLVAATAAIAGCVRARRPDLVLLAFATTRLALDAGDFPYYGAELIAAAAVADVMAARNPGRWPIAAVLGWVGWGLVDEVSGQGVLAAARLSLLAVVFAIAWFSGRPEAGPTGSRTPPRPPRATECACCDPSCATDSSRRPSCSSSSGSLVTTTKAT